MFEDLERKTIPVWNRAKRFLIFFCSMFVALQTSVLAQTAGFQDDLQALVEEITARSRPALIEAEAMPLEPIMETPSLDRQPRLAQNTTVSEEAVDMVDDSVMLNFQDANINALIGTVSQITGKNFIIDPRVKGKVTLISGTRLKTDQVYDIFLSVLEVHGFAAVESSGLTKILPANIIKQQPTRTSSGVAVATNDEQITQIYSLKHSSVQELTPILRPLLPPTSHFAPHVGSNTLVFTDTAANISRVLEIVGILDQPSSRSDLHVVMVQNTSAQRLGAIVQQVASSLTQKTEGGREDKINIQVDEGLNALIIQAEESQFGILIALIEQLDVKRSRAGNIHVVYLKYAKAAELVAILNEIAESRTEGEGDKSSVVTRVSVQADEDTNALVIRASDEDFQELQHVIEKLDLRRSQVFVETIIAEVSTTKASEIGVEWQGLTNKSSGGQISGGTNFSDSSDGGLTVGVINKLVTDLVGNVVPDLSVVLHLLRADSNANILSTPNLLTLDNETAEIIVGQEVPFVTGQYVSDASSSSNTTVGDDGVSTNNVVNPFQTIEREDVGLTLRITPQINEGGAIRLEIEQEISSVSPTTVAGASDLITNQRSIKATVLVDDGQIIVLGGLINDDVTDTVEWVPILGKIPLIGALFRKKTKQAIKRNLMMFLRPQIIRTPSDLYDHTVRQYNQVKGQQQGSMQDTKRLIEGSEVPVLPDISGRR